MFRSLSKGLLGLCLALTASLTLAQNWPTQPVRIVVAFPPGGSTDVAVRAISQGLSEHLGQNVIVENRGGAGGNIAADYVSKQPSDGYTLLATTDAIASNPHLYNTSWQPLRDFAPVIQLTRQPLVLAVHPSTGAGTLAELITKAKADPGMGYATSGAGSSQHMVGEWFAKLAGVKLTHVPYRGGGQAIADLLGGQVPIGSLGSTPVVPHHRAGRLKILAQSTAQRAPTLPDVPTFAEAGVPGLVLDQWLAVFAPAGTPAVIVDRINAGINKALQAAAVRERYGSAALEPVGGTAAEMTQRLREDHEKLGGLIRDLGIKVN
jgi:tripartite-type tricarboxylate transporter receptor subunit TctC